MSAADAARALYDFIQQHFKPGHECSLWSPEEGEFGGYGRYCCVSWEADPAEWSVLFTLGESIWLTEFELSHDHKPGVILQSGTGWYTEQHHRFDIGLIPAWTRQSETANRNTILPHFGQLSLSTPEIDCLECGNSTPRPTIASISATSLLERVNQQRRTETRFTLFSGNSPSVPPRSIGWNAAAVRINRA
jgi:hypothetical protein